MTTARKTAKLAADGRRKKRRASRTSKEPVRRRFRFPPEELEEFRQALLEKRRELMGDTLTLRSEVGCNGNVADCGKVTVMPIHMAELGSDTWEQELTFGFIEDKQSLLREIEEALERIEKGTYGICEATKKRITKVRLRAIPWARHCIEYARQRELGSA